MKQKMEIVPAILEKSLPKIVKKIKQISGLLPLVQIDICDGKLVPSKTALSLGRSTSFSALQKIKGHLALEIDLMVKLERGSKGREERFLKNLQLLSPQRIIFHFRSTKNWDKIFKSFKSKKTKIALGIWISDPTKNIDSLLGKYPFSYVQFMGIEKVGFGGQKLSPKIYPKIRAFRKKYPKMKIAVDGGVKMDNIKKLKKAGANTVAVGSGLFGARDIKERLENLSSF